MQLAFYRSSAGNLLDRTIDACSGGGGHSHVEIVFSDGMFFSSSGRDGGTRFKHIDPKPQCWDFVPVYTTHWQERLIRRWCQSQEGKKYDWLGVLGFVLPTHHEQGRWFCSEVVTAGLQVAGFLPTLMPWRVSPNILYATW